MGAAVASMACRFTQLALAGVLHPVLKHFVIFVITLAISLVLRISVPFFILVLLLKQLPRPLYLSWAFDHAARVTKVVSESAARCSADSGLPNASNAPT